MDQQSTDDRIAEAFLEWVRSGPAGDLVVMLDVIQDELLRRGRQVGAETAKTTTGADAGA